MVEAGLQELGCSIPLERVVVRAREVLVVARVEGIGAQVEGVATKL